MFVGGLSRLGKDRCIVRESMCVWKRVRGGGEGGGGGRERKGGGEGKI